jgi:hypothetical protein
MRGRRDWCTRRREALFGRQCGVWDGAAVAGPLCASAPLREYFFFCFPAVRSR